MSWVWTLHYSMQMLPLGENGGGTPKIFMDYFLQLYMSLQLCQNKRLTEEEGGKGPGVGQFDWGREWRST